MNTTCLWVPLPVWAPGRNNLPKSSSDAYHCCCHSCSCLSLAFSVLKLLIYSYFFARHTAFNLWWRNWSRRQNVPIWWLHKAEVFLYNVCMTMRCLLASEASISSFAEKKRGKKLLSTVNCTALDYTSTAVLIIHTLFLCPFHCFQRPKGILRRLFIYLFY